MPFEFDQSEICPACTRGRCIEDRRDNPVRGRSTQFRLGQSNAIGCTFEEFVPGTASDPDPTRNFNEYIDQFRANTLRAGNVLFPGSGFDLKGAAIAKVEGDLFEILEAAALWNAAAVWNAYMDTGTWNSAVFQQPAGAVSTPGRKVAIIKLPRGYDATRLFKDSVRSRIRAHESSLQQGGMELGLSSPDIVGVRIPEPVPPEFLPFLEPIQDLRPDRLRLVESAYQLVEGQLEGYMFLLAIAVKRSTRSDRLYQPLFEANVLKYLIEHVLMGSAFRFYVHLGTFAGADVQGHYRAASLVSLARGGTPTLAVDRLYEAKSPRDAAQSILDDLPLFPR